MHNKILIDKSKEIEEYVIDLRREFHGNPEISGKEDRTSRRIKEEIEKLGLNYEMVSKTGLIACLDSGREGKSIALRADIDALPIDENPNNLKGRKVALSKIDGISHSCGHDAHTAMLLGAMKILVDLKENLNGKIYFCFEEGEEIGIGIRPMMDALSNKKIDNVWGIHVYSALESGKISVEQGARMAGACGIDVTVVGKGGHISRPDLSANPIFAASCIMNNLASAWVNQIDSDETVTLGIASFKAGNQSSNIIPETANFKGSIRYFSIDEGKKALDLVKEISQATAKMHRCEVDFGQGMNMLVGPTINHRESSLMAERALNEVLPRGAVSKCNKWYASETMSKYLQKYPGVLAFLGIKNEELGTGAQHHNDKFDIDEDVLKIGVLSTVKYTMSFLNKGL